MSSGSKPAGTSCNLDLLPLELANRVRAELGNQEELLWVGQPRPDLASKGSVVMVVFGIVFTSFSLLFILGPLGLGLLVGLADSTCVEEPAVGLCGLPVCCFSLFGLPFIAFGIFMLTAPYWQRKAASKSCYVLTKRRAISWQAGPFGRMTIRSFAPAKLGNLVREENPDGSGNLIFEQTLEQVGSNIRTRQGGFMYISNVATVEELIRTHLQRPLDEPLP